MLDEVEDVPEFREAKYGILESLKKDISEDGCDIGKL